MSELEAAVAEVSEALEELRIPHMVIGGMAVAARGEPRATLDIVFSTWVEPEHIAAAVEALSGRFRCVADPHAFVARTRVLPIAATNGVRADIVFASLPGEHEMMARAALVSVAGRPVPVASVEDLVLMKLLSERPKDMDDARRLLRRHRATLDRGYLEPRVAEIAEAFARQDVLDIVRAELT